MQMYADVCRLHYPSIQVTTLYSFMKENTHSKKNIISINLPAFSKRCMKHKSKVKQIVPTLSAMHWHSNSSEWCISYEAQPQPMKTRIVNLTGGCQVPVRGDIPHQCYNIHTIFWRKKSIMLLNWFQSVWFHIQKIV